MYLGQRLQPQKILVIGDAMLDVYYYGAVRRISPEAPVPVFRKLTERHTLGGAGNVAVNLGSAGQGVSLMSVIGADAGGDIFMEKLRLSSIGGSLIVRSEERQTTVKTRFIASNKQQVFRLDTEDTTQITKEECRRFIDFLKANIHQFALVILSDYMKGLLTHELTQGIIHVANQAGVRVLVDLKDPDCSKYANAFLLKPNIQELQILTNSTVNDYDEIAKAAISLCQSCNSQYVLTTCGERGMVLVDITGWYEVISSTAVEVYDATGAGDTVIAYLGACLANGFDIKDAVSYSNIAAGIQVSKAGSSPVYVHEIDDLIRKRDIDISGKHKIIERVAITFLRKHHQGKTLVFTNGCFDILHLGHVRYLREAASHGDILVVGVNSDDSVRRLKGESRPINPQEERAQLLAALEFVDYVVIFDEDTPYELIRELKPDVLVKGADYLPEEVVGGDFVKQSGGKLVLIPLIDGKSTTAIINKVSQSQSEGQ